MVPVYPRTSGIVARAPGFPYTSRDARTSAEYDLIETSHSHSETLVRRESPGADHRAPDARATGDGEFPLDIRATTLSELCSSALADVAARFPTRAIAYGPDPDPSIVGAGEWDARRIGYAVTILLEDALKRTTETEPVSVRWRQHDGGVVLRVQYPRPLEQGDRFVTYFDEGVRPDGADDSVGTLRILAALKIARQHGGRLSRIRTHTGTAYVLELPRSSSAAGAAEETSSDEDGSSLR